MAIAHFSFMAVDGGFLVGFASGATVEQETIAGASVATTASSSASQNACRVAVDTACYVSFGSAPDASTDTIRYFIPAHSIEYFRIPSGSKAAVIAA